MRTRQLLLTILVAIAVPAVVVLACGPYFYPDVITTPHHPYELKRYAAGDLGRIRPDYYHSDLIVAYRYLHGGKLTQKDIGDLPELIQGDYVWPENIDDDANWEKHYIAETEANPMYQWAVVAAEFKGSTPPKANDWIYSVAYPNHDYSNCLDDSFRTAINTLYEREVSWGEKSATLRDWFNGQVAVFQNCTGDVKTMPAEAPADAPQLLKKDRAYQLAAAKFYAGEFDQAAKMFEAIGEDGGSPWQKYGKYLALRTMVREATLAKSDMGYNPALMVVAQQAIENALKDSQNQLMRAQTQRLLDYVRLRSDRPERVEEIARALEGPSSDPNFKQDMIDLNWALDNYPKENYSSPLVQWIRIYQAQDGKKALAMWKQKGGMAWLIASLSASRTGEPQVPELLVAAEKVKTDSPAYATVLYERTRLMAQGGDEAGASKVLDAALVGMGAKADPSTHNALLGLRMQAAASEAELLQFAPREALTTTSQAAMDVRWCSKKVHERCTSSQHVWVFDDDAAGVFNGMPIALWLKAAEAHTLPDNLQQEVVIAGWIRALELGNDSAAREFAKLLPQEVKGTAGDGTGFPAMLTLLRHPGTKPLVEQGVPREMASHTLDSYRDNWWCTTCFRENQVEVHTAWISKEEAAQGKAEAEALGKNLAGPVFLGRAVIAYARAHPEDKDVPEALALTVRATRYGWTDQKIVDGGANSVVSKQAFLLLHKKYPGSPWTAKTKYYY